MEMISPSACKRDRTAARLGHNDRTRSHARSRKVARNAQLLQGGDTVAAADTCSLMTTGEIWYAQFITFKRPLPERIIKTPHLHGGGVVAVGGHTCSVTDGWQRSYCYSEGVDDGFREAHTCTVVMWWRSADTCSVTMAGDAPRSTRHSFST